MGLHSRHMVLIMGIGVAIAAAVLLALRAGDEPSPRISAGVEEPIESLRRIAETKAPGNVSSGMQSGAEWVRENREPGWPCAELEGTILDFYAGIASRGLGEMLADDSFSRFDFALVRSLDLDGDGVVIEEEAATAEEAIVQLLLTLDAHPHIVRSFDANGDGELSEEEHARIPDLVSEIDFASAVLRRGLSEYVDRAKLDDWDSDDSGVLSETERSAGQNRARSHAWLAEDGHIEFRAEPIEDAQAQKDAALEAMREWGGDAAVEHAVNSLESFVDMRATADLQTLLREDVSALRPTLDLESKPESPPSSEYDADGDGFVDADQMAAYEAAFEAYAAELNAWRIEQGVSMLRARYENAVVRYDRDQDGRLTESEWWSGTEASAATQAQALFASRYDLDGDGILSPAELTRYVDWYNAGSLRADANFDGVVDADDAARYVERFDAMSAGRR